MKIHKHLSQYFLTTGEASSIFANISRACFSFLICFNTERFAIDSGNVAIRCLNKGNENLIKSSSSQSFTKNYCSKIHLVAASADGGSSNFFKIFTKSRVVWLIWLRSSFSMLILLWKTYQNEINITLIEQSLCCNQYSNISASNFKANNENK